MNRNYSQALESDLALACEQAEIERELSTLKGKIEAYSWSARHRLGKLIVPLRLLVALARA